MKTRNMTPHEHTHDVEITTEWPTICHAADCDKWPRIIDLALDDSGSRSYSHVSNKQDFIARRLNEAMFRLGWGVQSDKAEYLKANMRDANALLLSLVSYLHPLLYPEDDGTP